MTRHPDRARENAVRRKARRQGLLLVKSRRRDPAAQDYGRYALADPDEGDEYDPGYVFGIPDGFIGASLAECELWLRSGAWAQLRRKRASAAAAGMPKGDLAKQPGSGARSDARRPRSDARSDAPAPGVTPGAMPGAELNFPDLPGMEARSRWSWRKQANGVVATLPPDEERSIWDDE